MASEPQTGRRAWQDEYTSTADALQHMMKTELYVDVSVGQDRLAHKLILSLWSPVLADMLKNNKVRTVPFSDCPEITDIILRYMYGEDSKDVFRSLTLEKLQKLYIAAERFNLNDLRSRCLDSVHRAKITTYNVVDVLNAALRMNIPSIAQKCKDVIAKEGLTARSLSPSVSMATLQQLLTLKKVATDCESKLLRLAVSWLVQSDHMKHKYDLLSLIDLTSIEWKNYQPIVRDYPDFFSPVELSKVLLSVAHSTTSKLAHWLDSRTATVIKRSCGPTCSYTNLVLNLELTETGPMKFLEDFFRIEFSFTVTGPETVRLVSIELGFGPQEVSENCFDVTVDVRPRWHADPMKKPNRTYLDLAPHGRTQNYLVCLSKPANLETDHKLFVSFSFVKTCSLQLEVVSAKHAKRKANLFINAKGSDPRVKLCSRSLLSFWSKASERKLLVKSMKFGICGSHHCYLERVVSRCEGSSSQLTGNSEPPAKRSKGCHYNESSTPVIKMEMEETLL